MLVERPQVATHDQGQTRDQTFEESASIRPLRNAPSSSRAETAMAIDAVQKIAGIDNISSFPVRVLEILIDALQADGGSYAEIGAPGAQSFSCGSDPTSAAHKLTIPVRTDKRVEIAFAFWRREPFNEDSATLLAILQQSLAHSHAMLRRVDRLARSLSVVAGGRRVATAVLDADGNLSLIDGSRSILTRWFSSGSSLCTDVQGWCAQQRSRPLGDAQPFVVPSVDVVLVAYWRGERRVGDLIEFEEQIFDGADLRSLGLTAREAEVLALLVVGSDANTIAQRVGSRPGTVKKQIESVYRKLGVHTRRDAITIAVDTMMNPEH